jgi:hypothetical protein
MCGNRIGPHQLITAWEIVGGRLGRNCCIQSNSPKTTAFKTCVLCKVLFLFCWNEYIYKNTSFHRVLQCEYAVVLFISLTRISASSEYSRLVEINNSKKEQATQLHYKNAFLFCKCTTDYCKYKIAFIFNWLEACFCHTYDTVMSVYVIRLFYTARSLATHVRLGWTTCRANRRPA